jgi:DNA-binding Lrp family transcriptional regulator
MIRQTSIQAYHSIRDNGVLGEKQVRVYEILFNHGPLMGAQVSERFKSLYPAARHSETVRNRITELVKMGLVSKVGTSLDPQTKKASIVWDVTALDKPKEIVKTKSLRQQIKDLVEKVSSLEQENKNLRLELHICNDLRKAAV